MIALRMQDICFGYDANNIVLNHVSIDLEEGSTAAITGPSGAGKSTLGMIACSVIPKAVGGRLSGIVHVFGQDIRDKEVYETADQISMVFQDGESQLFAPMVIDELAFAPENLCFEPKRINERVAQGFSAVGMAEYAGYSPVKLSGGQQKLIALASILTLDPKIIILDEPAAGIDAMGIALLKNTVTRLKQQGRTIIIIEHEPVFGEFYDVNYVLEGGRLLPGGCML